MAKAKKSNSLWLVVQTLGVSGVAALAWKVITTVRQQNQPWVTESENLPTATVIVPARNEERNIERCVRSLLLQDYPDYQVIVVDDGSTDRTPQILAALQQEFPRLQVVRLAEKLPAGWAGKPHAMHAGYQAARPDSEWLLFSDADTCHNPTALRYSVATASAADASLYSVLPKLELESFWEKVLMPIATFGITVQYPLDEVNRPDSKLAIANGQFLLVQRTAFEKVGGWSGKLRNSLIDDRDMALEIKKGGGRVFLKDGREIVSVRMYTSLQEIWRGFSKNAFVGSRAPYLFIPFVIVAGFYFGVLPFLQLPVALWLWLRSGGKRGGRFLFLTLFQTGLSAVTRRQLDRALNVPPSYAFTSWLGVLVFLGIVADSMWRSLTKRGVAWKGRTYADAAKTQQIIK